MDGAPGLGRDNARPARHPAVHLVETGTERQLFLAEGSRLFAVDDEVASQVRAAMAAGGSAVADLLADLGLDQPVQIDDQPPHRPPLRSLSLAVAQTCNLGCGYCYAQGGGFGGAARTMDRETARGAVDRLFAEAGAGDRVQLAFLGGEPLAARDVIQDAVRHAAALSARSGVAVGYALTTNGTLIRDADADWFEEFGFAVTVSLDGVGAVHDRLRPFKDGRGSFDRIMANVAPLLARQRRMQVSARITVTPRGLDLPATLDAFVSSGFHSVGFSPLLAGGERMAAMTPADLDAMLEGMIACGARFERHAMAGRRYPFTNLVMALKEIHRGTHRPYPCGAGAGYFGVGADGSLAACHRFVGDTGTAMGCVGAGVDRDRQERWLAERHIHRQPACTGCWARYLCGGGCHYEVIRAGRPACDFIRGWLDYCLGSYGRLAPHLAALFGAPAEAAGAR